MLTECMYTNGKQVLNGQRNMLQAKLLYKSVNLPCRQIHSMITSESRKFRRTLEEKVFHFHTALLSFYLFFYFKTGSFLLMADLLAVWICEGVEKSVIIFTLQSAFDFAGWTLCNTRKTCEA